MTSKTKIRVRSYECDHYGHVNNAVYLHYLEVARYKFLKDINLDYKALVKEGYGIYISKIEISYKKPAFMDDVIYIESVPVKKGAASGVISQTIKRGNIAGGTDIIAEALVTWAFVGANGTPVKIPPEFDLPGLCANGK